MHLKSLKPLKKVTSACTSSDMGFSLPKLSFSKWWREIEEEDG